nr:hypothetical protein [Tanacetum cinerariifolium]
MNELESDDESVDTPLVSPFPHSDNDLDDGEVLNELIEYENVGMLCREKAINSFDRDELAFQCMIGFRKSVTYFDPFLPMNIITHKAYNTIMAKGLEMQTSSSGNTFLLAVAFFFRQWEVPSGSGNFLTSSGNALCILFPTILP